VHIDWYAGKLELDAGQAGVAVVLLSRFLSHNSGHAAAHKLRGEARMALGETQSAAEDFTDAIAFFDAPAPGLYRLLVLALAGSGESFWPEALTGAEIGFSRFGIEVALMGMAVDLALALGETGRAEQVFGLLKPGIESLPAWQARRALLACELGDFETTRSILRQIQVDTETRPAAGKKNAQALRRLPSDLSEKICRDTAADWIRSGL
jgi:tetratricopeptide (TPR) repeat protein